MRGAVLSSSGTELARVAPQVSETVGSTFACFKECVGEGQRDHARDGKDEVGEELSLASKQ